MSDNGKIVRNVVEYIISQIVEDEKSIKVDISSDKRLSTLPAIKKETKIPKKLDSSIIKPLEYPLIIPNPIIAIIIKSIKFIKLNLYLQYTEG